jgi:hypothetical protein
MIEQTYQFVFIGAVLFLLQCLPASCRAAQVPPITDLLATGMLAGDGIGTNLTISTPPSHWQPSTRHYHTDGGLARAWIPFGPEPLSTMNL